MWKKVCTDDYRRLKQARERKHNSNKGLESDYEEKPYPDAKLLGIADTGSPMPIQEQRSFICEYTDCSAVRLICTYQSMSNINRKYFQSFNSRAALNGHIRIHAGAARNSPTPSHLERRINTVTTTLCHTDSTEDYPCKICGK